MLVSLWEGAEAITGRLDSGQARVPDRVYKMRERQILEEWPSRGGDLWTKGGDRVTPRQLARTYFEV